MSEKYILKDRVPVPASLMEWARWFESSPDRIVAQTTLAQPTVNDDVRISTVFLGLDHAFGMNCPPLVFETMIFGGPHDGWQDRYSTWAEAEAGHAKAVALAASPVETNA